MFEIKYLESGILGILYGTTESTGKAMVEVVVTYRVNILEVIDVLFLFGMVIWMVMATMIILMAVIMVKMVIKVMVVMVEMVEMVEMEWLVEWLVEWCVEYVEAMVDQKDKDKENRMNIGQPKFVDKSSNKTNNTNNSKKLMSLHRIISV